MSSALNIGSQALNANLSALQVIGHNIANVNTAGYSRQTVEMRSAGYQSMGGFYLGKGVELGTVARMHDAYLTREAQLSSSVASADSERMARLAQLENIFPTGESGLGAAMNDLLNAWSDVASSPTNMAARSVVLGRGEEIASRLRDTAGQLDILTTSARQQVGDTVNNINRLAEDIAKINQKILENQGNAGEPNDLLDQRDQLIGELSKLVQVSTVNADDGRVHVFVAGSQPLVLGSGAARLAVVPDSIDGSQQRIQFQQGSSTMELSGSALGGKLGGVVQFIDEDLKDVTNQIGRMALALATTVNTQHALGVNLQGGTGEPFFVPPADVAGLPVPTNTGNAAMHAEVSDPTALKPSDYQVNFTATGVDIVRLSDGQISSFAGLPAELDGLSFQIDSGAAATGDGFLVRPFAAVARNMQMAVSAADRLAAASPVMVTPGSGNTSGMGIVSLYPVEPSANLTDPVTLTFLADGSFTATGLGPGNPPPDNAGPPPSYNYTPGQPLQFNGWSLTLRGNPSAGDSFAITAAPTTNYGQNGGNAGGMLALRDLATFDGVSLSNGYSAVLSDIGTRVQGAQFAASYSGQVAASNEAARAAVSGVNLDEEAARLLQYQQAYQAAAKFMQIAQGTFDTLLQTMR
ncbi:flagellar hook-associated protein FlgK [Hydrogenophaga pseudoflava]|uniref:Flagellar hook-associated protein 1 n=1 Tax=Hydrogenophaga pseudoflava TaxID=47421 RepID=A0A4P6X622_HYDPS|nr:flagellar hook-associated protein FlgK [Hydrogenophaga pseudoflava]QBM30018.1 Flagellar hook-associated protein 1 [Hydrogenophaga pseudoflava]